MILAGSFIAAADDFHLLASLDDAVVNPAHTNPADIVVVLDRGDAELKRGIRITGRRGNVFENRFKKRLNTFPRLFEFPGSGAFAAGGVEDGEVESLIIRAQLNEQVKDLIKHLVGPSIGPVNLVNDHDRSKLMLKSFLQNKA